jgi:sulfur carrier protein
MKIFANGAAVDVVHVELEAALQELGFVDMAIATAVNGELVAASERAHFALQAGDRLEVLAPMQGG